uniref:C-type lectin domain-containing protein n=1 Tax=Neolamprologus brichardi TaxID=32507 RepID=A0A3Q4HI15_NEOBR
MCSILRILTDTHSVIIIKCSRHCSVEPSSHLYSVNHLTYVSVSNLTSIHLLPAKSHVVKRSPRCPRGWTKYGRRCFFFNSAIASWANAEKSCKSMRAHLASVHNINEYREIQRLTGKKQSWIGGTDAPKEGKWFWSDGTCFTYQKWCFREPNNDRNQDCLQINRGVFKCWDDMWCDAHLPSVCAKEI